MAIQLILGLEVIQSYKRLSYTPWHAIAELVDNSTQSYFDHKTILDEAYSKNKESLEVSIVYDRENGGLLRVADNALGMSYEELDNALHVGAKPLNCNGRSQYGMGLKTAACWLGNSWNIRTKKLGETVEYKVAVDVDAVSRGENILPYEHVENRPKEKHYTIVEITNHNRVFHGRTIGKIRDFLGSMYRQDLRNKLLVLNWNGAELKWEDADDQFLQAADGTRYKKDFAFSVGGKHVTGWVGVLASGSRAKAGFSIMHADRVVKGWPESWRPESLYGQIQGSNDLVNQRLIGEIHMDEFEVSHTKDDILWEGDDEDQVQSQLKVCCGDYAETAKAYRKSGEDQRGPSDIETQVALDVLKKELTSAEMADLVTIETVPPPDVVHQALQPLEQAAAAREPTYIADISTFSVAGYLLGDASVNDPYLVIDSTSEDRVMVIINTQHPHWLQLNGSEGVLNYLRHCTYDGIAEWQARNKASTIDPDTIKLLKDKLLRLPLNMEMHDGSE
ncbi:MAG: ATP-binding protein [Dehalococcoidia bacterium]